MEQITQTFNVYSFSELSEEAKEKALSFYIEHWMHDWYEPTIETLKDLGDMLGIDCENIYFSGFYSQGDGACFAGNYAYKKGSVPDIKKEFPQCYELQAIAEKLQTIQKQNLYQIEARVSHSGHYNHEYCTTIEIYKDGDYLPDTENSEKVEKNLSQVLRDFMRFCYSTLEQDYEYQTSLAYFAELCESNDYQFYENGEVYTT